MTDKTLYERFEKVEPITKGWSEDKKYCVTAADGTKYLLRVTPISRYETRKSLFAMLEKVAALEVPMCTPVEFGTCDDGVYFIQSWIDGEDLDAVLPRLSEAEQYMLGVKSGEILRKFHTIPALDNQEEWATLFNRHVDINIQKYKECGLRFAGDDCVLAYIEQNSRLLNNRPQCFKHGDYFMNNMMIEHGELKIIDFESYNFGDPWIEFFHVRLDVAANLYFLTGQLRGYFDGEPPVGFFELYAFYNAACLLSTVYSAVHRGQSEIDKAIKQSQNVLEWFDNMTNPVPTWYLRDFHVE